MYHLFGHPYPQQHYVYQKWIWNAYDNIKLTADGSIQQNFAYMLRLKKNK